MIKNLKRKFISSILTLLMVIAPSAPAFAASEETNVNSTPEITIVTESGDEIILTEGETIQVPLFAEVYSNDKARQKFEGKVGYSELTLSGSYVNYKIALTVPASSFIGALNITDLSSGLSAGNTLLTKFSGSVKYNKYSKHTYRATLTGSAYYGATKVAYVTDNASIMWTA